MEILTLVLTSLGSIIGGAKNLFELRGTIKELFTKDINLNEAFPKLSKKDEKVLLDLYRSIEFGKELANRLYKKLALKYFTTLLIFICVYIAMIVFLQTVIVFKPIFILIGFFLGYVFITKVLSLPFKFDLQNLGSTVDKVYGIYNNPSIYEIRRIIGFINWMSPNESKYLQHYLDLCSLRDTIEIYWIDRKIEESKAYINETIIFRDVIEKTILYYIEDVIKNNKDVLSNRVNIENQIKGAGLERFLQIFGDGFFNEDFEAAYLSDKHNGVVKIIRKYW